VAAAFKSSLAVRATSTTSAPSRAKVSAISLPMLRLAPAMIAVLPFILMPSLPCAA
jgi:hypothetical protein